jgi:hypothetical protein
VAVALDRALQNARDDRWQSAAEMKAALPDPTDYM